MTFVNVCDYCGTITVGPLDEGKCRACIRFDEVQGWRRSEDESPSDEEPSDPLDDPDDDIP